MTVILPMTVKYPLFQRAIHFLKLSILSDKLRSHNCIRSTSTEIPIRLKQVVPQLSFHCAFIDLLLYFNCPIHITFVFTDLNFS